MLKILKKNQVVIYVMALMLVAAGYLNYTSGDKSIQASAEPELVYNENLADIGDATLVSSNVVEENAATEEITQEGTQEAIQETSSTSQENSISTEEYFSKSRLERETMYSQMLETYQNIVNSSSVSEEQRQIATQEITSINNIKNAIMICENLLSTKGFENNVVFVNGNSVSVVVKVNGELAEKQVAQIQNVISREMGVEVADINITQKN